MSEFLRISWSIVIYILRLNDFRKHHKNWDDKNIRKELNDIDKIRVDIALKSEKKCRKLQTGVVPYVPDDVQRYGREIWRQKSLLKIDYSTSKEIKHQETSKTDTGSSEAVEGSCVEKI